MLEALLVEGSQSTMMAFLLVEVRPSSLSPSTSADSLRRISNYESHHRINAPIMVKRRRNSVVLVGLWCETALVLSAFEEYGSPEILDHVYATPARNHALFQSICAILWAQSA
jgi:hypothetical protein